MNVHLNISHLVYGMNSRDMHIQDQKFDDHVSYLGKMGMDIPRYGTALHLIRNYWLRKLPQPYSHLYSMHTLEALSENKDLRVPKNWLCDWFNLADATSNIFASNNRHGHGSYDFVFSVVPQVAANKQMDFAETINFIAGPINYNYPGEHYFSRIGKSIEIGRFKTLDDIKSRYPKAVKKHEIEIDEFTRLPVNTYLFPKPALSIPELV